MKSGGDDGGVDEGERDNELKERALEAMYGTGGSGKKRKKRKSADGGAAGKKRRA